MNYLGVTIIWVNDKAPKDGLRFNILLRTNLVVPSKVSGKPKELFLNLAEYSNFTYEKMHFYAYLSVFLE